MGFCISKLLAHVYFPERPWAGHPYCNPILFQTPCCLRCNYILSWTWSQFDDLILFDIMLYTSYILFFLSIQVHKLSDLVFYDDIFATFNFLSVINIFIIVLKLFNLHYCIFCFILHDFFDMLLSSRFVIWKTFCKPRPLTLIGSERRSLSTYDHL